MILPADLTLRREQSNIGERKIDEPCERHFCRVDSLLYCHGCCGASHHDEQRKENARQLNDFNRQSFALTGLHHSGTCSRSDYQ
ncbi:hypothetical protein IE4872_PC00461 (plasmid) [Rhizobium gallicum]|uniref:Uncharacterized protein n=1 Tax=Rhizobium gallicum TaxID=56730 RepID=A0A1L5NRF1_9HYPH|nr:hypothetical protein IE4872_PC00461 [Rhizobium gallicum]